MPYPLTLILCESALELIPPSILRHPAIVNYARRRGRPADRSLLDRAYHHHAMKKLENAAKRGRPDIIHTTLLGALGSPLNRHNLLKIYIHTWQHIVIDVNPQTRIPRSYTRFLGLLEQLYEHETVPLEGPPLLLLKRQPLNNLIKENEIQQIFALSIQGEKRALPDLCRQASDKPTAFLVGGFPAGHFTTKTIQIADGVYRVYREGYETDVVACRLIHQYELTLGIGF